MYPVGCFNSHFLPVELRCVYVCKRDVRLLLQLLPRGEQCIKLCARIWHMAQVQGSHRAFNIHRYIVQGNNFGSHKTFNPHPVRRLRGAHCTGLWTIRGCVASSTSSPVVHPLNCFWYDGQPHSSSQGAEGAQNRGKWESASKTEAWEPEQNFFRTGVSEDPRCRLAAKDTRYFIGITFLAHGDSDPLTFGDLCRNLCSVINVRRRPFPKCCHPNVYCIVPGSAGWDLMESVFSNVSRSSMWCRVATPLRLIVITEPHS